MGIHMEKALLDTHLEDIATSELACAARFAMAASIISTVRQIAIAGINPAEEAASLAGAAEATIAQGRLVALEKKAADLSK